MYLHFVVFDIKGNINITKLIDFHRKQNRIGTVTAIQPPGRFGILNFEGSKVRGFEEKPTGDGNWINGGFFVLESGVFDYIRDDSTIWEKAPMENLVEKEQLSVYFHKGFWPKTCFFTYS